MPGKARGHYGGDYRHRAAAVRRAAYANPDARCWRCGLTLAEAQASDPRVAWQAGHVVDSEVNGLLRPEHSNCNASAGASYGNARREPRSQRWV